MEICSAINERGLGEALVGNCSFSAQLQKPEFDNGAQLKTLLLILKKLYLFVYHKALLEFLGKRTQSAKRKKSVLRSKGGAGPWAWGVPAVPQLAWMGMDLAETLSLTGQGEWP